MFILEFFPPDARRFGLLVLLPEERKRQLATWLDRARAWSQGPGASLHRPLEVFERNATGYVVLSEPLGRTLATQVASAGPLSGEAAVRLVERLAQSAAELLEAGLPVGEMDPSRVSLAGDQQWLTLGWADGGQEAYRAPEQWMGPDTETWARVLYSLGAVAHFAVTGQIPPAATHRALGMPLPPLPVGLPPGLENFLEQATQLAAHQRPPSLRGVAGLLRGQSGPPAGAGRHPAGQGLRVAAHRSWVTHLAMRGQVLVSAGADQQVRVWTMDGNPVSTLEGLRAAPVGLRLLSTGIVVADARGRVHCWAGNTYHSADSGSGIERLCALGEDRVVTLGDRQQLHLWRVPEVQALGQDAQAGQHVTALHEGHDGTLVLGTRHGEVLRYDPQRMQRVTLLSGLQGSVTSLVMGPRGHIFAACGSAVHLVGKGEIAILPTGVQALAVGGRSESLFVAAGRSVYRINRPGDAPQPLLESAVSVRCLSATGTHLAAGLEDGQLEVVPLSEREAGR
ncbi:hypothetical protein F8S09_13545 [Deinococcus sp. SDU3-2]|uniref:WD40 repeat domain-containing protein n=1 Tax=Deinococcus terrestris TaxID=2651870 RepID=A0A7X1TSC4_9DEIO|nr:hypothetical protein [Deinococcus terrestris]MPY67693.1 hypothetical protein [Deinococcus terrestris]